MRLSKLCHCSVEICEAAGGVDEEGATGAGIAEDVARAVLCSVVPGLGGSVRGPITRVRAWWR
jgi:hypothetical protein